MTRLGAGAYSKYVQYNIVLYSLKKKNQVSTKNTRIKGTSPMYNTSLNRTYSNNHARGKEISNNE